MYHTMSVVSCKTDEILNNQIRDIISEFIKLINESIEHYSDLINTIVTRVNNTTNYREYDEDAFSDLSIKAANLSNELNLLIYKKVIEATNIRVMLKSWLDDINSLFPDTVTFLSFLGVFSQNYINTEYANIQLDKDINIYKNEANKLIEKLSAM